MAQHAFLTTLARGMAAAVLMTGTIAAHATVVTFDDPVTIGPAAAPGVWYTDRYAPAGFTNGTLAGEAVLKQSISAADGATSRPGAFSGAFYNTQGRKLDLPTSTTSLSIDLFVSSSWASDSPTTRRAGLWGTAFAAGGSPISAFPIIEFAGGGFRFWDSTAPGTFSGVTALDPSGFDEWYTLSIDLVGSTFEYRVSDSADNTVASASVAALGSAFIGNTILQGHNTSSGVSYDIHWDNLRFDSAAAVPLPGSVALVGLGLLMAGALRRRAH